MPEEIINNMKALLTGGDGAPEFAPDGLLRLRKMSVERLARACGLTRTAVYYYIEGKCRPTIKELRRICEVLEVPLEMGLSYCTPGKMGRPFGSKNRQ